MHERYPPGSRKKFPVPIFLFPVSSPKIPCSLHREFRQKGPDFRAQTHVYAGHEGRHSMNFPVFFPVSRELDAETGSKWTGASASRQGTMVYWRIKAGGASRRSRAFS